MFNYSDIIELLKERGSMFDTVLKVIMGIGIPSIIVACVYIGKKLQILSSIEITIVKIKNNIKIVGDCLIADGNIGFDHTKLESYSPFKLTEKGEKFLEELGFFDIFKDHSDDFFNFIDSEDPKTEYDVGASAMKSIFFLFNNKYFYPIKNYLYENPKKEKLKTLILYIGVYVRDKYLEQHPELSNKKTKDQLQKNTQ